MTSTPANQTAARIWPTGTSLAGGSLGDVLSCAVRRVRCTARSPARSLVACQVLLAAQRFVPAESSFESRETTDGAIRLATLGPGTACELPSRRAIR